MTSKEFIKACLDLVYVNRSKLKALEKWVEKHPQDAYSEENLIDAYRYFEAFKHGDDIPCGKWRPKINGVKTTKRYFKDEFNR